MNCSKCGSGNLTPHLAWVNGGYASGYFLCGDCATVQATAERAAELRTERREERAEAATEAASAELLEGSIADLTARLEDIEDAELLNAALGFEAVGRNRNGALAAIQARIDALAAED